MTINFIPLARSVLLIALSFFLGARCFAAFPAILVIDGEVCAGAQGIDTNGHAYAAYSSTNYPSVILFGATGGNASIGPNLTTALSNPTTTGSWDGGMTVSLEGPSISVPQVLVYYPSPVDPAVMYGYDGGQIQSVGYGSVNGNFVVAYSGVFEGYIFTFGTQQPFYRYQAGTSPVVIDTTNGWPPPTVMIFPSQITAGGKTLNVISYTNGIANGFWANAYYAANDSSGVYGDLHAYIAPDGSGGQLYGSVNGSSVNADWDSTTASFVASSNLRLNFQSPSTNPQIGTPQYGPPQVEYQRTLMPFAYRDVNGSDIYWAQATGTWLAINSSDAVSVSDGTSYTYDPGAQMFSGSANLAAISADGKSFLGDDGSGGVKIYGGMQNYGEGVVTGIIFGGDPAPQYFPYYGWASGQYLYLLPDGNYAQYFLGSQYRGYYNTKPFVVGVWSLWVIDEGIFYSPTYVFPEAGQTKIINALAGWPSGDLEPLPVLNSLIFDGVAYTSDYVANGGALAIEHYTSPNDPYGFYSGVSYTNGGFNITIGELYFGPEVIAAGSGYSNDGAHYGTHYLSFSSPRVPSFGPSQIYWKGDSQQNAGTYVYTGTTNGIDTYILKRSGSFLGHHLKINFNRQVTTSSGLSGTYNATAQTFTLAGMFAQDVNENLLGISQALIISFSDSTRGDAIEFATGTTVDADYKINKSDGSNYNLFLGIADNTLFIVRDEYGMYNSSPLYRYSASEGGSFALNALGSSGNGWLTSNLYPDKLYINGHLATLDANTASNNGTGGGTATYLVQPNTGDTFTIDWTFFMGFSATVSGSYLGTSWSNAEWNGNLFGGLPADIVIATSPPLNLSRFGPAQILWDDVPLIFDGVSSSASMENPNGNDVYQDSLGYGLKVVISSDGSVMAYRADGSTFSGTYSAINQQFQFSGGSGSGGGTGTVGSFQVPIPSTPDGLTGTVGADGSMNLSWSSTKAVTYLIERETLATGIWAELGTTSATTYQDTAYGSGGYHYRVSATNASGTSAPSAEWPVSRYVVIDLGADFIPSGINAGGVVVGNKFDTPSNGYFPTAYKWTGGSLTTLGHAEVKDINDAGNYVCDYPRGSEDGRGGAYLNGVTHLLDASTSPDTDSNLGTSFPLVINNHDNVGGEIFPREVPMALLDPTKNGSGAYWHNIAASGSNPAPPQEDYTWVNQILSTIPPDDIFEMAAWGRMYALNDNENILEFRDYIMNIWDYEGMSTGWGIVEFRGYFVNNVEVPDDFVPISINNNDSVIGNIDNHIHWRQVGATPSADLDLGLGSATWINNANPPQILGNNPSGVASIWTKNPDSQVYSSETINDLLPSQSGWSINTVVKSNTGGAIIGTATYSGSDTNIAPGLHGVMLLPIQINHAEGTAKDTPMAYLPTWVPNDGIGKGLPTAQATPSVLEISAIGSSMAATFLGQSYTLTRDGSNSLLYRDAVSGLSILLSAVPLSDPSVQETLQVTVDFPLLGANAAIYTCTETTANSNIFCDKPPEINISMAGLSPNTVDVLSLSINAGSFTENVQLMETGPGTRIFTNMGITAQLVYNSAAGSELYVSLTYPDYNYSNTVIPVAFTSNGEYQNYVNPTQTNLPAQTVDDFTSFYIQVPAGIPYSGNSPSIDITTQIDNQSVNVATVQLAATADGTMLRSVKKLVVVPSGADLSQITDADKANFQVLQLPASMKMGYSNGGGLLSLSIGMWPWASQPLPKVQGSGVAVVSFFSPMDWIQSGMDTPGRVKTPFEAMGYSMSPAYNAVTADFPSLVKGKQLWYSLCHGNTYDSTGATKGPHAPFTGFSFRDWQYPSPADSSKPIGPITASQIPAGLDYRLVICDGCCSAQTNFTSKTDAENSDIVLPNCIAFANKFGPKVAYVGWAWVVEPDCQQYTGQLIANLKGKGETLQSAFLKFRKQNAAIPYAKLLKIAGNVNTIVDLTSNPNAIAPSSNP